MEIVYKNTCLVPYINFLKECSVKEYDANKSHKHHIIPKFMGGGNSCDNLILLSFEDHITAHYILANCFPKNDVCYIGNIYAAKLISKMFLGVDGSEYMLANGRVGKMNGMFGRKHTPESIQKMRQNRRGLTAGEKNPMYGKTHTDDVRKIISEKHKGKRLGWIHSEETKLKIKRSNSGKIVSEETKQKMRGKHRSEDTRMKQSKIIRDLYASGKLIHPWKGRKHSEESKHQMSVRRKGIHAGRKNPNAKMIYDPVSDLVFYTQLDLCAYHGICRSTALARIRTGEYKYIDKNVVESGVYKICDPDVLL